MSWRGGGRLQFYLESSARWRCSGPLRVHRRHGHLVPRLAHPQAQDYRHRRHRGPGDARRHLKAILERISALLRSAPPAPCPANAALLAAGSQRAHEADSDSVEEPAKRLYLAPDLLMSPLVFLPPPPVFAAPVFAPPLPTVPAPLPRAPSASNPPRVHIDPAREVLLGPMDWEKVHHKPPRQLILNVVKVYIGRYC
ncbi:hypothetical protein C8F04DRAFT_1094184 [Mycena alexandri]|uniref:Uncharacterized protein n=1 Tax=Mycena alexandri TaxID=1745969 RepID=A0AAD6T0U8_9AGAR|nr:hypothetical protein C8F04DRAFT_1094184 [Mycena alexandri]